MRPLLALAFALSCPAFAVAQQKPNIILILADDLGYKDCGYTGSQLFETPNIDALSRQGMVFNKAYAGAGNCAPSRGCLMSGQYTPRHGIYAVGSTTRGPKKEMKVVPVPNTNKLAPSFVTIAEALKAQGYYTGAFGKWHLGTQENVMPKAQGFDVYCDTYQARMKQKIAVNDDPKGIFSLTDSAISFIGTHRDKPFFVYLAHHAIHTFLEARPSSVQKFKDKGLDNKTAMYAGSIYDLDAGIAKLRAYLAQAGLDKNTLIVFTSDNGATQQSSQEPLRGNKGSYYEGGIREPFIVYWPGHVKAGSSNVPVINLDLYPTFLSLAGGSKADLDGENISPLFLGKASGTKRQSIFWHFPGYLNKPVIRGRDSVFRTRPVTAMRKGDWKIMLYHEEWILDGGRANVDHNNAIELYDLKNDEGERVNLALSNKAKRDEMLNELLAWMNKVHAPMPVKIDASHKLDSSDGGDEDE